MSMTLRFLCALIIAFGAGFPQYAWSTNTVDETIPDIPKPLKVLPSKIKPLQSGSEELSKAAPETESEASTSDFHHLDALSPRPEAGFSPEFWNDLDYNAIVDFLSLTGHYNNINAAQNLLLKAVLTPLPEAIKSDDKSGTLYAARLQRLVDSGHFDDAQKLYKLNEGNPPSSSAAIAGIESSLGHSEIAVACLDQKTFSTELKSDNAPVWSKIDTFCQALLGPVSGNDDELRLVNASRAYISAIAPSEVPQDVTPEDLNKLDLVTTLALLKTGKLASLLTSPDNVANIDDKHLGLIVGYLPPLAENLHVIAAGAKRNLLTQGRISTFIKAIDLKTASASYASFLKFYLRDEAASTISTDLILASETHKITPLIFGLIEGEQSLTFLSDKKLTIRLLLDSNHPLSPQLVKTAYQVGESTDSNANSADFLLISSLLSETKPVVEGAKNHRYALLNALMMANYPQNDTKNAYDNILSLTPDGNYVMPMGDILSSLKKSADKKQMNQVVIRSLAILDGKSLDQLHPAVLYQILEALNSAGLTEETQSLTRDVLRNIMKN